MKTPRFFFFFFFAALVLCDFAFGANTALKTASPEEYYNTAIAEKNAGDLPAASLSLRRALVLDPTLAVAQQQLQEVLSKMGLTMESSWQQKVASRYSPEKITFIGTVIGWGTTAALVVIFFLQILPSTTKPKRWRLFFSVVLLCLMGHGLSVLGVMIDPRLHARYEVILLPKIESKASAENQPGRPATTSLRATPVDAASVLAQLPTGSCLILLSQHGAWSFVRTSAGQEGWLSSGSLEFLIPKN